MRNYRAELDRVRDLLDSVEAHLADADAASHPAMRHVFLTAALNSSGAAMASFDVFRWAIAEAREPGAFEQEHRFLPVIPKGNA
ncbi:hypothetical protein Q9314_28720 (plasmid) [Shinella sumterensis]|nr:hypothetical protein Q9314_28720 [Shinella sumterensis]